MEILFDAKLLEHIRLNAFRFKEGHECEIFGYRKIETLIVVTGWFHGEPFSIPVSESLEPLGAIGHSNTKDSSPLFAKTDEELLSSETCPFLFSADVSEFETTDVRRLLRGDFLLVYLKALDGCRSTTFHCDWDQSVVNFPPKSDILPKDKNLTEVFFSQMIDSDTELDLGVEERETVCLIPRSTDGRNILKNAFDKLMNSPPTFVFARNGYMHVPVVFARTACKNLPKYFPLKSEEILQDPHYEISDWPNDSIVSQDGTEYFHYNVDGFNDCGWGCAYRSTQTILSWFINNRNVPSQVPSIITMQTVLKKIDYAHSSLVPGAKAWIGCIEAGSILNSVSDGKISYKILSAFSLDELENFLIVDVRLHLVNVGTPVLVGAGNFAFTVVGVSRQRKSVLVLDPHLPQGCSASAAVARGYVGWKLVREFFNFKSLKATFVNICLPS